MSHPGRSVLCTSLLGLLLATAPLLPAMAELADRSQPMQIEADSMRYDESTQTSVFEGRVVVSKGSILLKGVRIEIRQDNNGQQWARVEGSTASPATFRQKREGLNEYIDGQAQRIEYDSQQDTVRLSGQAALRRLRGATPADETTGNVIVYDNRADTFTVEGGVRQRNDPTQSGRVRTTITPRSTSVTPPPAAAPLKSTPALESRQ